MKKRQDGRKRRRKRQDRVQKTRESKDRETRHIVERKSEKESVWVE